jgi:putative transposase
MRKSKFSESEIVYAVKQAEAGIPVTELAWKYGVSAKAVYAWRKKYGGLSSSELQRLKQLEEENWNLKRLVADLSGAKKH